MRQRIQAFQREHSLRLHMTLLLSATAGAAAVVSKVLWWLGIGDMHWRYPVAAFLAYGVFLGLVRLWLWYVTGLGTRRRSSDFEPELPEFPEESWMPHVDLSFDLDELFAPVMLALAVCGFCFAGIYLVWAAPELLTEIALEGLLAAGMHQGVRRMQDGRWLWCMVERPAPSDLDILAA